MLWTFDLAISSLIRSVSTLPCILTHQIRDQSPQLPIKRAASHICPIYRVHIEANFSRVPVMTLSQNPADEMVSIRRRVRTPCRCLTTEESRLTMELNPSIRKELLKYPTLFSQRAWSVKGLRKLLHNHRPQACTTDGCRSSKRVWITFKRHRVHHLEASPLSKRRRIW